MPEEKGKIYEKVIKGVTYINYEYDRIVGGLYYDDRGSGLFLDLALGICQALPSGLMS